jgi:hypothetical protein
MKTQLALNISVISILILTGCNGPKPSHNYGLRQEVGIDSYPQHARVYIDGDYVGKTPLSAQLRANRTYEVVFEKSGYKPYVEYIGPDLDMKLDPFIKIGPLESQGMYNRLGPNPLQVEMEHELVPDIAGPDLLKGMLVKTEQLDKHLAEGLISIEEHRYVTQQILAYYKDESYRRGNPILIDEEPQPAQAPVETSVMPDITGGTPPLPSPTTPSTPGTDLLSIDLDNLELDDVSAAPVSSPTVPSLDNINIQGSGIRMPVESPTSTPPPATMPENFQSAPSPGAPLPPPSAAPTPPVGTTPATPPASTEGGGLLDFGF